MTVCGQLLPFLDDQRIATMPQKIYVRIGNTGDIDRPYYYFLGDIQALEMKHLAVESFIAICDHPPKAPTTRTGASKIIIRA
jgi:hypothetical protein